MKSVTWKILLGPLLAGLVWLSPLGLEPDAQRLAGLGLWVICWWLTEALPLPATALLVPVLGVMLGIVDAKAAFASFAHPLIFLFLGGFLLAKAVTEQKLDQRISLKVLLLPGINGNPLYSIWALILLSAFFSMWISNTATTAMLFPIALGIAAAIFPNKPGLQGRVLLPVAYASSIGGISTPIGSTPNIILLALLDEGHGVKLTFLDWMAIGLPISVVALVFLLWFTKKSLKALPKKMEVGFLKQSLIKLGPTKGGERNVLFCIVLAAFLWVLPSFVKLAAGVDSELFSFVSKSLPVSVVAILASLFLFILKDDKGRALLSWPAAQKIDWGTLLLFGGGLSLGSMAFSTGLAEQMGQAFLALAQGQFILLVALAVIFSIFFTEVCSNTATANMLLPIMIAISVSTGVGFGPAFAVALACSLAFMIPIATPPNAIVFGSGLISIKTMMRTGFALNVFCAGLLILAAVFYF